MPAVSNSPPLTALKPERRQLVGGLRVAAISQPGAGKAAISMRVAAGSHDEPTAYPGLAHFLEHLLFLGSHGYAVEDALMAFVQGCGGQLNASTQARHTEYFYEVPAERLGEALARLLDMLARPLLDKAAQLREREVVHAEFIARAQDPDTLVAAGLAQALPAGHRCAAFQAGDRDSLKVEEEDFQQALLGFHRRFYQAGQLSLLLVGPQSVDELFAMAQQHARVLTPGVRCRQTPPVPLLALRERHLRMRVATAGPALHLAFALEWATPGMGQALEFVQTWLRSEAPGGLLAGLREAGLCQGLKTQVIYRYAEQSLLLLSFSGVDSAPATQARLTQALLAWLAFFADAERSGLHARYQRIRQRWLGGLSPLALARCWQGCLEYNEEPSTAEPAVVAALLAQMQEGSRRIALCADAAPMSDWPAAGFTLQMRREAPVVAEPHAWAWQLPQANVFLEPRLAPLTAVAIPAQLRWLPAPLAEADGQAVLHGRCLFAGRVAVAPLQTLFRVALRALEADAAEVGVALHIVVEAHAWQLSLQGPAALLPRLMGEVLPILLDPPPEAWRQSVRQALEDAAQAQAEMALRQLLRRLPELFAPPGDRAQLTPQSLREAYRGARFEGLGVAIEAAGRTEIEALFAAVSPLPSGKSPEPGSAGRYWQDADIVCDDSLLLLFCPQPASNASTEVAWRLLAQLYQGAFFRRMRSELQLGYAVFCGFRQVRGRGGILFAVQSPHTAPVEILGHIQAFLQTQGERLATLGEHQLRHAADELREQLQSAVLSSSECAEQCWQAHLAGLPERHDAALQQALASIVRSDLLECQRKLGHAQGGWYVLANAAKPDADWLSPN
nr:pyrroloquinoline quinone biosynthesis protein PqqF [uncultured Pseudomonas sp.]